MKKLLTLCGILLISSYVHAQTGCAVYHKGYFKYSDSAGNTILVHRKNKYQYEDNRKTKVRTQYAIDWVTDCEYTLTQTLTNSTALKKYRNSSGKTVILKSDGDNGYYYNCMCNDDSGKGKESFMKKITKEEYYQLFYPKLHQ